MKTFTFILLFISVTVGVIAQTDSKPSPIQDSKRFGTSSAKTHFSIGYQVGIPVGEYAEALNKTIHGLDMVLAIPLSKQAPVYVGANYSYGIMGGDWEHQRYWFTDTDPFGNTVYYEYEGRATTLSKIHGLHGLVRIKSSRGPIRPYVDALAGFRHFSTTTKLEYRYPNSPSQTSRAKQIGNSAWSYGAAFGMHFPLKGKLSIDVRGSYMLGQQAEYADPQSIQIDGATLQPVFSTKSSTTNMAVVTVGISF